MKHADRLIDRILYLEGLPNLQRLGKVNVGETVPEQFELDLQPRARGHQAAQRRHRGLPRGGRQRHARRCSSRSSVDEEEHADWLETQQEAIKQIGASSATSPSS